MSQSAASPLKLNIPLAVVAITYQVHHVEVPASCPGTLDEGGPCGADLTVPNGPLRVVCWNPVNRMADLGGESGLLLKRVTDALGEYHPVGLECSRCGHTLVHAEENIKALEGGLGPVHEL